MISTLGKPCDRGDAKGPREATQGGRRDQMAGNKKIQSPSPRKGSISRNNPQNLNEGLRKEKRGKKLRGIMRSVRIIETRLNLAVFEVQMGKPDFLGVEPLKKKKNSS